MTDQRDDAAERDGDALEQLRMIADRLELDETPRLEAPPAGLWERIAAEVDDDVAAPTSPRPLPGDAIAPGPQATVVPLDEARQRRARRGPLPWMLGVAAAVLAVVIGVIALADRSDEPTQLASASLERLGPTGSGEAELVDRDGHLALRVSTADLDPGDGFLEVWIIDEGVTRLVSLGPVRPDGLYDLPPGLDPHDFPVVDISVEPLDGNPTHSGDSVLRGQLVF